ncbi:hypothetical protein J7337_003588 [Fusarium musae]|uniref:40S ribosomal protein S30 n=1 Tax=Fusarium musae TaxID=1042133 RepID=A0A9P8DKX9_9HYPO|nr:hypothetical protein J7337_003588 [Fusarium musae]KAG9503637.1 hypothetical protein J7337_003588 [Fusarium musae]
MGKVHGSLARAGKVKSQTPKVEKQEKTKTPKGRALKRLKYTRRFVNVTLTGGKRKVSRLEHDRERKTGADDSDTDEPQPRLINDSSKSTGICGIGKCWLSDTVQHSNGWLHSVMG